MKQSKHKFSMNTICILNQILINFSFFASWPWPFSPKTNELRVRAILALSATKTKNASLQQKYCLTKMECSFSRMKFRSPAFSNPFSVYFSLSLFCLQSRLLFFLSKKKSHLLFFPSYSPLWKFTFTHFPNQNFCHFSSTFTIPLFYTNLSFVVFLFFLIFIKWRSNSFRPILCILSERGWRRKIATISNCLFLFFSFFFSIKTNPRTFTLLRSTLQNENILIDQFVTEANPW